MSTTPDKPNTLDGWVTKLHEKGFRPDTERSALVSAKVPDSALIPFTDERCFTFSTIPPEHVAIVRNVNDSVYFRNGVTTNIKSGDFAMFYTNYQRRPPIDTLGFFNSQGEPLDSEAREIQARLFD